MKLLSNFNGIYSIAIALDGQTRFGHTRFKLRFQVFTPMIQLIVQFLNLENKQLYER